MRVRIKEAEEGFRQVWIVSGEFRGYKVKLVFRVHEDNLKEIIKKELNWLVGVKYDLADGQEVSAANRLGMKIYTYNGEV